MKRKLLEKKKYPAVCETCLHGRLSPNEKNVLCVKKGIVETDGKCRKYSYDPLKRRPKKPLLVERADPAEFDLSIDAPEMPSPTQSFVKEPEQEPDAESEQEPVTEPEQETVIEPEPEPVIEPKQKSKSSHLFEPVKIFDEDSDV